jgi:hypothetical protein
MKRRSLLPTSCWLFAYLPSMNTTWTCSACFLLYTANLFYLSFDLELGERYIRKKDRSLYYLHVVYRKIQKLKNIKYILSIYYIWKTIRFRKPRIRRRDPSRWPRGTLYPRKLALTSPTSRGRSVGIVHLRNQATGFFYDIWYIVWYEMILSYILSTIFCYTNNCLVSHPYLNPMKPRVRQAILSYL